MNWGNTTIVSNMAMQGRHRRLFSVILALMAGLAAATGDVSAQTFEEDAFPIYFGRSHLDQHQVLLEEDFFYPFGYYRDDGDEWWAGLRPFVSWGGQREGRQSLRILPPFIKFDWESSEVDYRVLPLWTYRRTDLPNERRRIDHRFYPFFAQTGIVGETVSSAYGPLYGHLVNRFGVDEAEYWLFPAYLRTRRGEFVNHSVLFPFLGFGSGGGGSNIRIWPFFGHKVVPGRKNALFIAWPLYGHQLKLDADGEVQEDIGSFPLFVSQKSPTRRGLTILWPFFQKSEVNRPRRQMQKLAAPFPFYQRKSEQRTDEKGEIIAQQESLLVFPAFGRFSKSSRRGEFEGHYTTPFYWDLRRTKTGHSEVHQRILFPFVWLKDTRWLASGGFSRDFHLWPFLRYEEPEKGGSFLRLADPFWFRRHTDMDRHYSALLTVFERERDAQGYGYDQFLGKSIYRARYADYYRLNLLHLYTRFSSPEQGSGWEILRGLVGRRQQSGRTQWRFLWWPW